MNKYALKNAISSALSYGVLLIFNVITSKVILVGYGSEVNGLLSSINQIFSYIALMEAGIGTATITALYKPIADKNYRSIGDVLATSKYYYSSSAKWYAVCVLAISFIWPYLIDTTVPVWETQLLIIFQGISGIITFCYTSTITNYLIARGKNYINNHVHIVATLSTYILKLFICYMNANVVFISLSLIAVNLGKCLFYRSAMKKLGEDYCSCGKVNIALLNQRNAFLAHEISGVIFAGTDMIIISVFCGLKEASVYAVYAMVFSSLASIIGQVFNGTNFVLGKSYAEEEAQYPVVHDGYNRIYILLVFAVFTVAYYCIIPFVALYTKGIADVNYIDERLPLLFVSVQLLSSCRIVDNQLIKLSMHAKKTIKYSVIESAINLLFSILLVQFVGIYGVLLGTILALLYRSNNITLYANHVILRRSAKKAYGIYGLNICIFAVLAALRKMMVIPITTYLQLLLWAAVCSVSAVILYFAINLLMDSQLRKMFTGLFAKRRSTEM